jgi:FkbM family methyltransferase
MKKIIVNYLPFLGKYKRFFVAWRDSVSGAKKSYSQHKEDVFILDELRKYDLKGSVYVDIGANHPTDISNTYLLYRNGFNGVIVEPNLELAGLFNKFRRKDIVMPIGCSDQTAIMKFNISRTPVVSTFHASHIHDVYKTVYVPVLKIDEALSNISFSYISLLSIDVEGMNIQVLKGALQTLEKSLMVCIEFDDENDKVEITNLLSERFDVISVFGCNLILMNRNLKSQLLLNN